MGKILPPYVFRGSVLGWPGGTRAQTFPATYTTANPAKAVLFAIAFSIYRHGHSVVLICPSSALKKIEDISPNNLAHLEEEIIFKMTPLEFEKRSGYVKIAAAQQVLKNMGINTYENVSEDKINTYCKIIPVLSATQIENFVNNVASQIEKP
jgi:hypothetical protein